MLLAFYWRMRRARVREVMRSRALLQKAYAELNRRVAERTADLSQANEQLQKEVAERTRAEQELRAAHDELIQASKLAALGQMAAGITHELNQPLAALRGFSDNTRVLLERGDQASARENLEAIAALTERMGKITNQLKLFVGRARPRSARAPIMRALRNVIALLQKRLQGVEVEFALLDADTGARTPLNLADDHPELVANCDELRLEQVLINLLGNALDATAGMTPPRISIEIETADSSYRSPCTTTAQAFPTTCCRVCSNRSSRRRKWGMGWGSALRFHRRLRAIAAAHWWRATRRTAVHYSC